MVVIQTFLERETHLHQNTQPSIVLRFSLQLAGGYGPPKTMTAEAMQDPRLSGRWGVWWRGQLLWYAEDEKTAELQVNWINRIARAECIRVHETGNLDYLVKKWEMPHHAGH
jgi:hypothetical protein